MRIQDQKPGRLHWRSRAVARGCLGSVILLATLGLAPRDAAAQARAARPLRQVEIEKTAAGWDLELIFEFPVRYLRHSPSTASRLLQIQIDPIDLGPGEDLVGRLRADLPIPRGEPTPLRAIAYDGSLPGEPFVDLQFSQSLRFEVMQGSDIRRILVRAQLPEGSRLRRSQQEQEQEQGIKTTKGRLLLARARDAIRDKDLPLAIALLSRILELSKVEAAVPTRRDARELLGLTHERQGQLAHAQAEYQAYLDDYPHAPAAERVRQRLNALATAEDAPRATLRPAAEATRDRKSALMSEAFGNMAARYFRSESIASDAGGDFLATNLLVDLDLAGRLEAETWALRGDFTGTYDFDLAGEGRSDDPRISRLSLYFEDRIHGWEASLGRQRRNDSGVLGRFDGGRIALHMGSHFTLSALAGLPVERTSDNLPNTDAAFGAAALDVKELGIEGLQSQLFLVGQERSGLADRLAIGGEIRFAGEQSDSFIYLDYDVLFNSLNTLLASTSYRLSEKTNFRGLFERRNSPVLTLQNALQGQFANDLDDLKGLFSDSEIRDLAQDRTAASWSGSIGVTHRLSPRYQLSGDLSVSHLEGTKTSAGVLGTEAAGPDFGGSVQMIVNDWLVDGGVGSLSLRYFEGEALRSFSAVGYSSFRLPREIRLIPRMRWTWRDSKLQGSSSVLRPSLEAEWRYRPFLLNAEAGAQWREPISSGRVSSELDYFVEVGIQWEF